jgi:uncharacterized membrane protein YjjP (DUF1212 family)
MQPRNNSSATASPRRARFDEEDSPPPPLPLPAGGLDHELMRAAFESQAKVQRDSQQQAQAQQQRLSAAAGPPTMAKASSTPRGSGAAAAAASAKSAPEQPGVAFNASSPFAPGYSLAASGDAERSRRSLMAQDVSPLEPVPATTARAAAAHFQIGDDDEAEATSDGEGVHNWQSCKGRRSTAAFIDTPFGPQQTPQHGTWQSAHSGQHTSLQAPPKGHKAPIGLGLGHHPSSTAPQQQQQHMPQRPPPTATVAHLHQPAHNFSPRPLGGPFSPRPSGGGGGGGGAQHWQAPPGSPPSASTPHIQRYDPFSSPSMVQPFSPRVLSSGSIKSPGLKPALIRREQSVENFRAADAGDPCERGVVRETDAQDVRRIYSGQGGFTKALVGLYGAVTAPGDGTERAGLQHPTLRERASSQSLGGDTLRGDDDDDEGATYAKEKRASADSVERGVPRTERLMSLSANAPFAVARRQSMAWTLGEDETELDPDDPRLTGKIRKSMQLKREAQYTHRRSSWSSETGDPDVPMRRRPAAPRRLSFASIRDFANGGGGGAENNGEEGYAKPRRKSFDRRKSTTTITANTAHVMHRQKFILKLAKALMLFGAPSHRIESQLNATANVLEVDAQFIHFPGLVIASFGDVDKHTSETHFVKSKSDLALGPLHDVHIVYRRVVHDEIGVEEGTEELNRLLRAEACWSEWSRIGFAAIRCWLMAPMSFGGSFIDAFVAAAFGAMLTFLQLRVTRKNAMYSNVFEISTAIMISFVARGLSTTGLFCYQSIASSGLILVLPGYIICACRVFHVVVLHR